MIPHVNALWARALVEELARCGVRDACIAPGSRSTPLVEAFARHPAIQDHPIVDERTAAFFALGRALATRRAVALVCTSGTAAANVLPAVCEASHAGVPLIVLTADRPPHLQDCGASQAMNQMRLFGHFVRFFHQVDQPEPTPEKLRYLRSLACRAVHLATGPDPGPVHLNLPFRKPLAPTPVPAGHRDGIDPELEVKDPIAVRGRPDGAPYLRSTTGVRLPERAEVDALWARLHRAERPLVFAGADPRGVDYARPLSALARALGIPVIAEPTSGLLGHPDVLACGDALLSGPLHQHLEPPDLILRTGRSPLGWSAAARLRGWSDAEHIAISAPTTLFDPDHLVSWHLGCDQTSLFEALLARASTDPAAPSSWLRAHLDAEHQARRALEISFYEDDRPLTTPDAWDVIGQTLTEGSALFVSSSMPIRDLDTFAARLRHPPQIFANRGLNGIDGVIATGLGLASAHPGPTVIVVGDVAFRHDRSAVLLAEELGLSATLIVLDNGGGAIFEQLPIADHDRSLFDKHFASRDHRGLSSSHLPLSGHAAPTTRATLAQALGTRGEGLHLIHVRTDSVRDQAARTTLREAAGGA